MKYLVTFILLIPSLCYSQKNPKLISNDSIISKWNNAIVNLEMRDSHLENKKGQDLVNKLEDSLAAKKITIEKYNWLIDSIYTSFQQYTGTAIYFIFKKKKYLITARHVLFNKQIFIDATQAGLINKASLDTYLNTPYKKIFRIPLDGEVSSSTEPILFLYESIRKYIFSDPSQDLAIISLNKSSDYFADFLEKKGHIPISLNDIDTVCNLHYGQDLSVFGFPFFSNNNFKNLTNAELFRSSPFEFVNSVTFGKISSIFYQKYFFIGDASIAPGNSGGAIVSNNKLIGIVSSQPYYQLEDNNGNRFPNANYRMPYTIGIKASYIMPLLRQLMLNLKD